MSKLEMDGLGLELIEGADVWGGVEPFWIPVMVGITVCVAGAVINNWATFTSAVANGYADGASGNW